MCGIVGFMGRATRDKISAFNNMLVWDQVRGDHSTGAAGIRNNGVHIVKKACLPNELIKLQAYNQNIDNFGNYCLLGHNRFATQGRIKDINAHPFEHGSITLVHNGTIWNKDKLPKGNLYGTDSEAITSAINELGIDAAWKQLDGPCVLVWWDRSDDSLNIITNTDYRPFFFSYNKSGDSLFFSSEMMMHVHAMARHGIELDKGGPMYPEKDILYKFRFKDALKTEITFEKRKLEGFVKPPAPPTTYTFRKSSQNPDRKSGTYEFQHADGTIKHVEWWTDDNGVYHRKETEIKDKSAWLADEAIDITEDADDDPLALPARYGGKRTDIVRDKEVREAPSDSFRDGAFCDIGGSENPLDSAERTPVSDIYTREDIRYKDMDEKEFRTHYEECAFCGDNLQDDYEGSVVLDEENAICDSCIQTAEHWGQSIRISKGS